MGSFYRKGLHPEAMKAMKSSTNPKPERQKRFWVSQTEESSRLMLMTASLDDVVMLYEHSWFRPGAKRDRNSRDVIVTCKEFDLETGSPGSCSVCSEQMFCDFITRRLRCFFWVVDLRVQTGKDGTVWRDTPKLWALPKDDAATLAKQIMTFNKGGRDCRGIGIEVSRKNERSSSAGDVFSILGKQPNPWAWLLHSPRVKWYRESVWKYQQEVITPEQARDRFFAVPDLEELLKPTEARVNYFLAFVKKEQGGFRRQATQAEDPWAGAGFSTQPDFGGGDSFGQYRPQEQSQPSYSSMHGGEPEFATHELFPEQGQPPAPSPAPAPTTAPAPANIPESAWGADVSQPFATEIAGLGHMTDVQRTVAQGSTFPATEPPSEPEQPEKEVQPPQAQPKKSAGRSTPLVSEDPEAPGQEVTPENFDDLIAGE